MEIRTIASSTPLLMDVDGDGTIDTHISPGEGVTKEELVASLKGILKGIVKTLGLSDEKKEIIIKKIDKLKKALEKEYKNERKEKQKIGHAFERLSEKIRKFEKKKLLTHEDATELLRIVERIRGSMLR